MRFMATPNVRWILQLRPRAYAYMRELCLYFTFNSAFVFIANYCFDYPTHDEVMKLDFLLLLLLRLLTNDSFYL